MKRLLIILVLIGAVIAALIARHGNIMGEKESYYFRDDFDRLDKAFWYVGEWGTLFEVPEKISFKNGILSAIVTEQDRGPILISTPIKIAEGDVITIKRRARLHFANEHFTGGMSVFETGEESLEPMGQDKRWNRNLGDGLLMVEYVHNASVTSNRPGTHTFRVLPKNWDESVSILFEPVFDDWFEEELIYDTRDGEITYKLGDQEKTIKGAAPTKENLRVVLHNYGWYTGHEMKLDWFEIKIVNKPGKKE